MSGVNFDTERSGYVKEQVDAYVNVIQQNYQKAAKYVAELEVQIETMQGTEKLEEKIAENQSVLKQMNDEIKQLAFSLEKKESSIQAASLRCDEIKEKLLYSSKQAEKLAQQVRVYSAENEEEKQLAAKKTSLLKELAEEKQVQEKYKQEKEEFQTRIDELNEQVASLQKRKEADQDEQMPAPSDPLNEIIQQAKGQAAAYMESIKTDNERELMQEIEKAKEQLAKLQGEAAQIKEQAKNSRAEEDFEEIDNIKKEKKILEKQREEFLAGYDYVKREAEVESKSAREEAVNIMRRAKEKLEIAKEKEMAVTRKTQEKILSLASDTINEYSRFYEEFGTVIKQMQNMYGASGGKEEKVM